MVRWFLCWRSLSLPASSLAELRGLESAKRLVTHLGSGSQAAHAVLFYGAKGTGKSILARELALRWLCTDPRPEGACGECKVCGTSRKGTSVDLLTVEPAGASRWIRRSALSSVSGDEAISAKEFLRTGPLAARNKVLIVEDIDRLTPDAVNAMLQMLEEPPPYAKWILTSREVGSVPQTIVSRCVSVRCETVVSDPVGGVEEPLLKAIGTSPGRMLHLLENLGHYRAVLQFAHRLLTVEPQAALVLSDELRALAEDSEDVGARQALAKTLESLALILVQIAPESGFAPQIAEAHRLVLGNSNGAFVVDRLVLELLRERNQAVRS